MAATYNNIPHIPNFPDINELRDNFVPDESGVGYPKRVIFMGTNTTELHINNSDYFQGDIVFLPQENKFMVYAGNQLFTEIQILTDEDHTPTGLLIDGSKYRRETANEISRQNLGEESHYKTTPEILNNLT
jgi:hypothetical protein